MTPGVALPGETRGLQGWRIVRQHGQPQDTSHSVAPHLRGGVGQYWGFPVLRCPLAGCAQRQASADGKATHARRFFTTQRGGLSQDAAGEIPSCNKGFDWNDSLTPSPKGCDMASHGGIVMVIPARDGQTDHTRSRARRRESVKRRRRVTPTPLYYSPAMCRVKSFPVTGGGDCNSFDLTHPPCEEARPPAVQVSGGCDLAAVPSARTAAGSPSAALESLPRLTTSRFARPRPGRGLRGQTAGRIATRNLDFWPRFNLGLWRKAGRGYFMPRSARDAAHDSTKGLSVCRPDSWPVIENTASDNFPGNNDPGRPFTMLGVGERTTPMLKTICSSRIGSVHESGHQASIIRRGRERHLSGTPYTPAVGYGHTRIRAYGPPRQGQRGFMPQSENDRKLTPRTETAGLASHVRLPSIRCALPGRTDLTKNEKAR